MISVIIPTLNRASLLRKTLASIAAQTFDKEKFEVLVIDNGSVDDTAAIIDEFRSVIPHLRYLVELKPGLHEGRHRGMKESLFDILVFADDDIEALPSWLEGIAESFEDPATGLVGGKNIPNYESTPPDWINEVRNENSDGWYNQYYSLLDLGDSRKTVHQHFVFGCNFSVRKDLLLTIGGFHPDGMPPKLLKYRGDGESYVADQIDALGFKTIYNPKASVLHWVPASRMTVTYLQNRAHAEGITQSYRDTRQRNTSSLFSLGWERLKNLLRPKQTTPLQKELEVHFKRGYEFHQSEMKKDPELVRWVLRTSYL